jgi:hypothetical protein
LLEHGSGDLGTWGLDVGSLSLGYTGLPPVRVSTGQVGSLPFFHSRDICTLFLFLEAFSLHSSGLFLLVLLPAWSANLFGFFISFLVIEHRRLSVAMI